MAWSGGKEDEAARSRMLLASAAEPVDAMRDGVHCEQLNKPITQVMLNLVSVTAGCRARVHN
jgi:hypothetical protein